jgi:translocation and assembly module TamA
MMGRLAPRRCSAFKFEHTATRDLVGRILSFFRCRELFLGVPGLLLVLGLLSQPARADVAYVTTFTGVGGDLMATMSSVSQLVALKKRKPPTRAALRRRAQADLDRLKSVLESQGYYDSGVEFTLDGRKTPVQITVVVQPGPQYRLGSVEVVTPAGGKPPALDRLKLVSLGLKLGAPALAGPVIDAEPKLVRFYTERGWPLAKIQSRRVVIDTATKTMAVTFVIDAGLPARFGVTRIEGLKRLRPGYVRRRIAWDQGETYDQRVVDKTRDKLVASGLFGGVVVEPADKVSPDGTVPMQLRLAERALRTVSAGISYDTSLGAEATLGWEHRDLFGGGEDLKVTGTGGESDNGLQLNYDQPDFGRIDQDFIANLGFDNQLVNAFRTIQQQASIGIARHFNPQIFGSVSLLAQHARINEEVDTRVYTLVGVPVNVSDDQSNDPLNPTKGYRLNGTVTPYFRAIGSNLTYVQGLFTGTHYTVLDRRKSYILAVQGILGATGGTSLASIPKDHRFFAGGGGSVRGFGYQEAGPLDSLDNPIGGRSMAELSLELRIRLTDTLGIVPFYDAGSDYPSAFPDFSGPLYQGAGLGFRYFSAVGPIRLDLATPLNPRHQDSPIQVYVSIGQAF